MRIVLATGNLHKLQEIQPLLGGLDWELATLKDFPEVELPEETGSTMAQNARLKAVHCAMATGLPSLADDSGIEVDALNGEPGVRSARWLEGSDRDRTQGVLDRLSEISDDERKARYRCAICLAWPDGRAIETEATCEGKIGYGFHGENGFGYDPIFVITLETGTAAEWIGHTMAQAPPEVKALVSHRARAISAMREKL